MPRLARFVLGVGLCLTGSNVFAQSAVTELYGEGVHRFFAGSLVDADQYFTRVIETGVEDPRAHYFRGLVREMQGGGGEYDFEAGARLEAEGAGSFDIGKALTRIQGHTRTKIEKYRLDARVAAQQQRLLMDRTRAEAAPAVPAVPPTSPTVPSVDETDPFGAGSGTSSGEPMVDPVQPAVPEVEANDPFADDPLQGDGATPPATPDASDPFGTTPADPVETDPFGGAGDVPADDPFGGAADADDPFGN